METQSTKTKTKKQANPFQGWKSANETDDWTMYKTSDFQTIQKKGEAFTGYLVGYKFTKKKAIPMFYFVTDDGEMLKCFGNGNLTSQMANILDQAIDKKVGILYEGKEIVDLGGKLGEKEVNQWKVYFDDKSTGPRKLIDLKAEIDGLYMTSDLLKTYIEDRHQEKAS